MFIITLIIILLIISVAAYKEGNSERKGLRFILSIMLAIMLSLVMEGTLHSLVLAEVLDGTLLIVLYFTLPILSFFIFQLLLFDIKMFGD